MTQIRAPELDRNAIDVKVTTQVEIAPIVTSGRSIQTNSTELKQIRIDQPLKIILILKISKNLVPCQPHILHTRSQVYTLRAISRRTLIRILNLCVALARSLTARATTAIWFQIKQIDERGPKSLNFQANFISQRMFLDRTGSPLRSIKTCSP